MNSTDRASEAERTYRPSDLEDVLHVSTEQVRTLIKSGRLEAVNVSAGSRRARFIVTQSALDRFLSQPAVEPSADIPPAYKPRWTQ